MVLVAITQERLQIFVGISILPVAKPHVKCISSLIWLWIDHLFHAIHSVCGTFFCELHGKNLTCCFGGWGDPVCQPFCPLDPAFFWILIVLLPPLKLTLTWKQWEGTICVWVGWSHRWEWYQVLIQGIERAYEKRGGSAKRIGSGAFNLRCYQKI